MIAGDSFFLDDGNDLGKELYFGEDTPLVCDQHGKQEIIRKEISAFAGGIRSAEKCAAVIQSLVSIRLAEHK